MTTIEKLQADMLYNEQHPLFAPYNDEVMGERFAGRYERLGEDEEGVYKRWYFDNGHNYTLVENTNMLYECEPIPEDYFIHKHIEKCIYDIVTSHSDVEMPEIVCTENEVLSMRNPVVLIRTIIDRENRNVAITNIHVQREHWYNGYGKQLLLWGMQHIRKQNENPITLHVAEWNQGALKLYEKVGFAVRSKEKIR